MTERPVGLTKDAGWEVGASRTFPVTLEAGWDFLLSPAGLTLWLGEGLREPLAKGATYETDDGTIGQVRSLRPYDRVRLTWRPPGRADDATLQLALTEAAGGCSVRFHAERLASADERERMRKHLHDILDRLGEEMPAA
jgi:uncharacterized protein YndB with AHSA1/START domain